ncbi:MAG: hypothetical protein HIU84_09610, partial [Acidobacteria bacterium]|nr:hypothetical protein [Acidobacteriota bacterium]
MPFIDRSDAGRRLGSALARLRGRVIVVGLARGGVPVAFEVAQALDAPLDVIVVRKLGVPYEPELALEPVFYSASAQGATTGTIKSWPIQVIY